MSSNDNAVEFSGGLARVLEDLPIGSALLTVPKQECLVAAAEFSHLSPVEALAATLLKRESTDDAVADFSDNVNSTLEWSAPEMALISNTAAYFETERAKRALMESFLQVKLALRCTKQAWIKANARAHCFFFQDLLVPHLSAFRADTPNAKAVSVEVSEDSVIFVAQEDVQQGDALNFPVAGVRAMLAGALPSPHTVSAWAQLQQSPLAPVQLKILSLNGFRRLHEFRLSDSTPVPHGLRAFVRVQLMGMEDIMELLEDLEDEEDEQKRDVVPQYVSASNEYRMLHALKQTFTQMLRNVPQVPTEAPADCKLPRFNIARALAVHDTAVLNKAIAMVDADIARLEEDMPELRQHVRVSS
ncbi:MAG: hypothetical protein MHM6MM_000765 [Cercozoa sp. M6MM]